MIRTVKHRNGEFIVINTTFEVKERGEVVKVPIAIQVDTTKLSEPETHLVYKATNGLFNRTVTLNLNKPKAEKPWYKRIFN